MTIYHQSEEIILTIFRCPICEDVYMNKPSNLGYSISCTVMHGPGSCCHYSDKLMSDDRLENLMRVARGKETE